MNNSIIQQLVPSHLRVLSYYKLYQPSNSNENNKHRNLPTTNYQFKWLIAKVNNIQTDGLPTVHTVNIGHLKVCGFRKWLTIIHRANKTEREKPNYWIIY